MATKKRGDGEPKETKRVEKKPAAKTPRIRASHATSPRARAERAATPAGAPKKRPRKDGDAAPRARGTIPALKPPRAVGTVRKAPLGAPKRPGPAAPRRPSVPPGTVEPSAKARELALAIAGEGIEKKAIGIEILDVTGRVDYADFLVVMTGRSDRHVHAIATGLEEAMRKRRIVPLSIEGLQAATWVLIDFGDVVVHVFQEEARALYDIEGLWIDASRVPVPSAEPPTPLDLS